MKPGPVLWSCLADGWWKDPSGGLLAFADSLETMNVWLPLRLPVTGSPLFA